MCRMVADPKLSSDHLRHSRAGPYLAPEAVGWGTSLQKLRQLGALLFTQARPRAPGGGWRLKPSTPSCSARFIHWLTAPLLTPNARAMSSRCLQPSCLSSHARRRRPSRQSVAFWLDGVFSIWLMIPEFSCFRRDQSVHALTDMSCSQHVYCNCTATGMIHTSTQRTIRSQDSRKIPVTRHNWRMH
jgi:hypothetical protein